MRRSDSLNTFSSLSLYGLLTRFICGSIEGLPSSQTFLSIHATPSDPDGVSSILPFTMLSCWLPVIGNCRPPLDVVTRLNSFRDGATSLTACMVPCVRLRCVVRFFFTSFPLLHSANTQYGWLAIPYPAGTLTLQETPSFPWRTRLRPRHRWEIGTGKTATSVGR